MTCRCSRPRAGWRRPRGPRRRRAPAGSAAKRRVAAALALAAVLAGCGQPPAGGDGPQAAAAAFLARLASGDVPGICRSLTPAGAAELARDFGGSTCRATATEAARYVAVRPGARRAVRRARILPTLDVPLSPAPYRAGARTAALRLVIDDPVLRARQALDVGLRLDGGRWRVDGGVNALFTLVRARGSVPR